MEKCAQIWLGEENEQHIMNCGKEVDPVDMMAVA